ALASALPPNPTDLATVCRLDTDIGQTFAEVAALAVRELCDGAADLVVSHGQTVYHWVDDEQVRGTLQLGVDPAAHGLAVRDDQVGGPDRVPLGRRRVTGSTTSRYGARCNSANPRGSSKVRGSR